MTMAQIVVFSASCASVTAQSVMVPHAASDNGPPWIAAFLDLVRRLTLASTRRRSASKAVLIAAGEDRMSLLSASRRANQ